MIHSFVSTTTVYQYIAADREQETEVQRRCSFYCMTLSSSSILGTFILNFDAEEDMTAYILKYGKALI